MIATSVFINSEVTGEMFQHYMAPSLRLDWTFCFCIFFLETFFCSGSSFLLKACSFSTRQISMWQGLLM